MSILSCCPRWSSSTLVSSSKPIRLPPWSRGVELSGWCRESRVLFARVGGLYGLGSCCPVE